MAPFCRTSCKGGGLVIVVILEFAPDFGQLVRQFLKGSTLDIKGKVRVLYGEDKAVIAGGIDLADHDVLKGSGVQDHCAAALVAIIQAFSACGVYFIAVPVDAGARVIMKAVRRVDL